MPSEPATVTVTALVAVTLKLLEPPAVIEDGVAVIVTEGAGLALTVTVAVSVTVPPAPVAVAVYVVVVVGLTA